MDRRQFLIITTVGGLGAIAAIKLSRDDGAPTVPSTTAFAGTVFVHVHAGGGWDATSLCDPKGRREGQDTNTWYDADEIEKAGNLRYAPLRDGNNLNAGRDFFQKHHERLLVINGIDTSTSLHDRGDRHIGCGRLDAGYPSFGALYSAAVGQHLPLAYLSFGPYDETVGLVTRTRTGMANALAQLGPASASEAEPLPPSDAASGTPGPPKPVPGHLDHGRVDPARLSEARAALGSRFAASTEAVRFEDIRHYLPKHLDTSDNPLIRQVQVSMASARAGLTSSCNLYLGGCATYRRHDDDHVPRLIQLLDGIDFLWEEAGRQGIQDRLVISCGSSCGRAPTYNDQHGKEDWPITSMLLMGRGIKGNRVIGATDERYLPLRVNPSDFATDPDGVLLAPRHVHLNLRRLAGLDGGELAARFPLDVPSAEDIRLLG